MTRLFGASSRILQPTTAGLRDGGFGWPKSRTPPSQRAAAMRAVNPVFVPRNHRVETAIQAALKDDVRPFNELVEALSKPFVDQPDFAQYADPPQPHERVLRTFCGT